MKKPDEKELEQFIQAALQSLPDRRAPGTLEARVLAEIEHRSAIAWYHKSWSCWPAPIRAVFLAGATGISVAMMMAFSLLFIGVEQSALVGEITAWGTGLLRTGAGLGDFFSTLLRNLPPLWLYGGLAFVGVMYAALFGLGAAAYRLLYRNL